METLGEHTVRARLEASKDRLAAAFNHLEQAIEFRIQKAAAPAATNQNNEYLAKTEELTDNLQQLTLNYNNLKEASTDVFNQLNTSITTLETFLKNKQSS